MNFQAILKGSLMILLRSPPSIWERKKKKEKKRLKYDLLEGFQAIKEEKFDNDWELGHLPIQPIQKGRLGVYELGVSLWSLTRKKFDYESAVENLKNKHTQI